jgi:dGTPase
MIGELVGDLIRTSSARIEAADPANIDDVRAESRPLIGLSDELTAVQASLKQFLRRELYTHPHVQQMTRRAHETISALFDALSSDFDLMPAEHAARAREALATSGRSAALRTVADYIAGMTDRFALQVRASLNESESAGDALLR